MSTRVLIVEDNPVARGFLVRVVRESFSDPIEIVESASLASARAAMQRHLELADIAVPASHLPDAPVGDPAGSASGFRLILCALELVDGHGLELLRELQHDGATRVATTLYSDDDHLFPALQFGADGYLLKEDRFEVVVQELQRIVRGQPTMSPAIARRIQGFFRHSGSIDAGVETRVNSAIVTLSPRDTELLGHLAKGYTFKEIARLMVMRLTAINEQILAIYRKLAAASDGRVVIASGDDRDDGDV
jgi:DNA-binding NarL/FixJ family response regulator